MTPENLDVTTLAAALIAAKSVSPARGPVFDVLADALAPLGFTITRTIDGDSPDGPVENMIALRSGRAGTPHIAFAGHVDVVPAGDGWTGHAFTPRIADGRLYGRGAADMKGAVAAFVAAAAGVPADAATISLLITGDEEGPAIHGTRALMRHMQAANVRPDYILVGEPSSTTMLGDTVKIGRRGSVTIWIHVPGREGHVAYPHLADNPLPRLVAILAEIDAITLDHGNDFFQPSNIEITTIDVGNPATNVIPAGVDARLSIRFNDLHKGADLAARITAIVHAHAPDAQVTPLISGEAFRTQPGPWVDLVSDCVAEVTGLTPERSTTGGTSDARFLHILAPIVEMGLPNATMHKRDESAAIADLIALSEIYRRIILRVAALG